MELIHPRCAGLDVHKKTVVACIRVASNGGLHCETRTFGTTTPDLLLLGDWLLEHKIQHAVMESTGIYWKPIWHVLESFVELTLANAHEVRNLPGRKSDVKDAQWLADLLAHGLLRRSFVPNRELEEIRDLTRTRRQLVHEITRHAQRIDKQLQSCNIKLKSVLSKTLGKSGRRILRAMIAGETDPKVLADLVLGVARNNIPELERALDGFINDHHRFLLKHLLDTVEYLESMRDSFEERIAEAVAPFNETIELLETIPGVGKTAAPMIIGEIGTNMDRFPTAEHLVSWAGLCPRLDSSAGKSRSRRIRKGNRWLKTAIVQAAWSAIRSGGRMRARYYRLRGRIGKQKALIAVARTLLTVIYHMLSDGQPYRELGEEHIDERERQRRARALIRQIKRLGYDAELQLAA